MAKLVKEELNERGQVTYCEYSDGSCRNWKYNEDGRLIHYENSKGYWEKWEYDKNGRETHYEDSDGYWVNREFDKNGRETYYENSKGLCVKRKYNKNGKMIYSYQKNSNGSWEEQKFDDTGRETYYEDSTGYWEKQEYDEKGRYTYYENSDGSWVKQEFDKNGRQIYSENQDGVVLDKRESKEHFKDLNEKNENQEIAFLFDGTKIGERSQSFNDGYVIINARTKDEAVETFKAQYGRGQHNEALCTEVVFDSNRVEQIKNSDLPCHNYIDLTKPQKQNQSNTEEQTDGRK